jgi:RNA polymerase sigma-70 factor (ECF subfamily)
VLVNGAAGFAAIQDGKLASVMACTVIDGKIVEIDIISDPARLGELNLPTG